MTTPRTLEEPRALHIVGLAIAALALVIILKLHLLILLLALCAGFALVRALPETRLLKLAGHRASLVASFAVLVVPVMALVAAVFALQHFASQATDAFGQIVQDMSVLLERWRSSLPQAVLEHLPGTAAEMQPWLMSLIKSHSEHLTAMGKSGATGLLLALVGLIIGVLIANDDRQSSDRPLATTLRNRSVVFQATFIDVVVSQVWIALINTVLTAVFFMTLPLFDLHMPYATMLLALTFFAGLLPVVGNLLCNTVTTVLALTVSPTLAVAALIFLVLVHKLEYFISAKVVGSRTSLTPWELLLAIFAMEAAFGAPGLVAAPLLYAYLKRELMMLKWV